MMKTTTLMMSGIIRILTPLTTLNLLSVMSSPLNVAHMFLISLNLLSTAKKLTT